MVNGSDIKSNRVYGQNNKIWYLCIPCSFLFENHLTDIDVEMGDKGLMIYFRLLMMAGSSNGVLEMNNKRIEPLKRLAGRFGRRYTEDEISHVLTILEENDKIKVIDNGKRIVFVDVYQLAINRQARAMENNRRRNMMEWGTHRLNDMEEDFSEEDEMDLSDVEETSSEIEYEEEIDEKTEVEDEAFEGISYEQMWKRY